MFNQYLANTYQYLTNIYMNPYLTYLSTNAKLILTEFLIDISVKALWKFLTKYNINSIFHSGKFLQIYM